MKKNRDSLEAVKKMLPFVENDREREERVLYIKSLVEKGKYKSNSGKIAQKVINDQLVDEYMMFLPILMYLAKECK